MVRQPVFYVVVLQPRASWKGMSREERRRFIDSEVRSAFDPLFVDAEYGILLSMRAQYKDSTLLVFRLSPDVDEQTFQDAFTLSTLSRHFVPHWDWAWPVRAPEDAYDTLVESPDS